MRKHKHKHKYKLRHRNRARRRWFYLALLAMLLVAPHAMVIRMVVDTVDPYYWVLVRACVASVIMLPLTLLTTRLLVIRKAGKYVLLAGVCMGLAALAYSQAIYYSQASYVVILSMLTPIILIVVSAYFFRERITHRKVAGIALAMLGATAVALLPFLATNTVATLFYPQATLLTILQSFLFVGAFISLRKAKAAGLSAIKAVGLMAPIGAIIALPAFLILGDSSAPATATGWPFWLAVLYSALGVGLVFRAVTVSAYEKIGAVSIATLTYLENLLAVILPVVIIGEVLSIEMILGGTMILLGIYLVESRRSKRQQRKLAVVSRASGGL